MKNKKILILGIILIVFIIVISIIIINSDKSNPEDSINKYFSYINEKNYEGMYEVLTSESKNKISKEDFITKNKNIYEGIGCLDIKTNISDIKKENNITKIAYNQGMETSAGKVEFSNNINLKKEDDTYKIEWSSTLIHPDLKEGYKIRVKTLKGTRGSIVDRNKNELACNDLISSVGIVPGKLGDDKEKNISEISKLTGVSVENINKFLSASYVKDDTFVPIKKVSKNNTELKEKLLKIPGVMINDIEGRVYPLGEEAAHLVGYVQNINAEELEKLKDKGYTSNSIIGKSGLELIYEDRLKATDGVEIYIENEKNEYVKEIAKREHKNGETITITIDSQIQKKLYDELKNDKGLFVVMHPQKGELLALVSTPSYDSNDFVLGMTNEKWEELNNNPNKPLYNRFLQSYCPGSTFKSITGAIGLETGKINADDTFNYSGLSWQKDSSWGDYRVTTLTGYKGAKNMQNALIHSDNIYFAQAALKIGKDDFINYLNKIGFNEQLEFPFTLAKSKYSNSETIESDGKLADSGFGQGNILVNPIHMASIYSAFANNGNMVKPYIEYKDTNKTEYWKEKVFSENTANTIKQYLIQVVENPEGTANDMKIAGKTIAGKTGTAELKQDKNDNDSGTLGWFDCFTIEKNDDYNLLIISMVENSQNNVNGGSHYLIKKIKNILL